MTIQVFVDATWVYFRHDPKPFEYAGELWQFLGQEGSWQTLPDRIELRSAEGVVAVYTLSSPE